MSLGFGRAKRALDLAKRSEASNPGDPKGAEPPFLALPQRPEGRWKKLVNNNASMFPPLLASPARPERSRFRRFLSALEKVLVKEF